MVVLLRSKSFEGECPLEDPWYFTKYSMQKFSENQLSLMKNPSKIIPHGSVGLPPKNTLLPKSLDILPPVEEESKTPKLVKEWEGDSELWHMKDDKFNRPKAMVSLKIYPKVGLLQELGITSHGKMITDVWVACIKEHLREFLYMAQMASLELEISTTNDAVTL